jgi:putative endonuclease
MYYYLYILKCADGTLYTGITTDLKRRVGEHNGFSGNKKSSLGARYTHSRRPVKLVYSSRKFKNRSTASLAEAQIKKLKRSQKLSLIKN